MRAASPMIPFQPPISSISGASSTNLIPSKDNYSSYKYGGGGGASSMMMIQSGRIGSFKGGI